MLFASFVVVVAVVVVVVVVVGGGVSRYLVPFRAPMARWSFLRVYRLNNNEKQKRCWENLHM